jgi:hypothetical protein
MLFNGSVIVVKERVNEVKVTSERESKNKSGREAQKGKSGVPKLCTVAAFKNSR